MTLTRVDFVSWPGSPGRANEDACGQSGDWAWVIDASVLPGTAPVMHPTSDAAWFAAFTSGRFDELAPQVTSGPELVRRVIEDARRAYFAVGPGEGSDPAAWPTAALTLVHALNGFLEVWSLGDAAAYLRRPSGATLTLGDVSALRVRERTQAAVLMQETGAGPDAILETPAFREWAAGVRRRQASGAGPAVFGLVPESIERMDYATVPCPHGSVILLASDGFSALVELYEQLSADDLLDVAVAAGLGPLLEKLRRIETEVDPDGVRYPRFKRCDDATALLLRQD